MATRVHIDIGNLLIALQRVPGLTVTDFPKVISTRPRIEPFLIFFCVEDPRWLYVVGRAVDRNYGGWGFRVELSTCDSPQHPVGFALMPVLAGEPDLRAPDINRPGAAVRALTQRLNEIMDNVRVLEHFGLKVPG